MARSANNLPLCQKLSLSGNSSSVHNQQGVVKKKLKPEYIDIPTGLLIICPNSTPTEEYILWLHIEMFVKKWP